MTFQIEASLLVWGLFWLLAFWSKGVYTNTVNKKRIMAQKYFREMGNFGQRALRHQSRWFWKYHDFRDLFLLIEKVWQVWNCSKSWCVPSYQILVFSKLIIFCCLIFEEFEKSFWIRNFKANYLSRRDQKVYSIFQNRAPRGTKVFNRFQSGSKYLSRWVYYQQ